MRPTRGVALLLVGALVLHLLAGRTGAGWLALGSAAALALPLAALLLRPRLDAVEVEAEAGHGRVGAAITDRLTVRNSGERTSPALLLIDSSPGFAPLTVAVPALAPGAHVVAVLERTPTARGWWPERSLAMSSTAPFGLLRVRRQLTVSAVTSIGPRAVPHRARELAGAGSGGAPTALAGAGTEVLGLRPWRVGDGAAAVSARASARHGRPVVLDREREQGPRLVVVCTGAGSGPDWEAAVERSCAVVEHAVRDGRVPVLLATGLPVPPRPDLRAVLEWHAALDRCAPPDAATLAAVRRAAGPGGQVSVLGRPASGLAAFVSGAL